MSVSMHQREHTTQAIKSGLLAYTEVCTPLGPSLPPQSAVQPGQKLLEIEEEEDKDPVLLALAIAA